MSHTIYTTHRDQEVSQIACLLMDGTVNGRLAGSLRCAPNVRVLQALASVTLSLTEWGRLCATNCIRMSFCDIVTDRMGAAVCQSLHCATNCIRNATLKLEHSFQWAFSSAEAGGLPVQAAHQVLLSDTLTDNYVG